MEQSHCLRFFSRILTRFCRKIVGLASDRLRLHRRRSETISASVFSFNLFSPWVYVGERGVFWFTTIPPYESSETITVSVRIVAGRLRFSRRAPETSRKHWISTWISNPTQNLATSLRLFGGRIWLIGGRRRSSDIVSGMPKMGEQSCEQSSNFKFKVGDSDGCGDA